MNDYATSAARERRALEMLGSYQVKTAGGIMIADQRRILDGWIYASHLSLLFLADEPLRALSARFPGLVDAQTVLLPIAERPASRLTAPMLTPNGIIAFADGVELIGAKKRMRAMHALLGR